MKKQTPHRRHSRIAPRDPLLPRTRRGRRRVAFFGATTIIGFAALIALAFGGSAMQQRLLGRPQVAAVVSAVLADLANADRAHSGLGTLKINPVLTAVAQAKANDMATKGYFAHTSPEGKDPWFWFDTIGYPFDYAGENLAIDFSDSGDVERAWMNSPTHRENLLDPHFTEVGIATSQGMYQGRPTTFVVQEFGTPAGTSAASRQIAAVEVPEEPAKIATAETKPQVLGTAIAPHKAPAPAKKAPLAETSIPAPGGTLSTSHAIATTEPALAGQLAQKTETARPLWGFAVAFPRETLRYAYYVIGILVLIALVLETGFELRWHHRRHALRAGMLLVAMVVLFIIANTLFFAQPVLAAIAG